jgi:hypothetical protein
MPVLASAGYLKQPHWFQHGSFPCNPRNPWLLCAYEELINNNRAKQIRLVIYGSSTVPSGYSSHGIGFMGRIAIPVYCVEKD